MKLSFVLLVCLSACRSSSPPPAPDAAAVAPTPAAASGFEGEIDLSVGPYYVTTKLKGDKAHMIFRKLDGRAMSELFIDGAAKKVYTPLRGRKYAELDIGTFAAQRPLVATNTGQKDTVLGHECEILNVVDGQTRREICLAKDLPPLRINVGPTSDGQGFQPSFGEGFPLRIIIFDAANAPTAKMLATRIEAKTEPSAEIEIRSDWEKVPVGADAGAPR